MLAEESDERVLLLLVRAEQGKTYLLLRLLHECEYQTSPVPVVLLDFDKRKGYLTDYLSVAREVRRQLGDQHTPNIRACEEYIYHRGSLVSVQTGEGEAGVDFGEGNDFGGATVRGVTGRDSIQVDIGTISQGSPTPDQIARQGDEMGRALGYDLTCLADSHRQVVLLMDAFEQASAETCTWLERWLFEPLRRELSHVLLVVAGRPQCRPFFARPLLWSSLVETIDCFTPFDLDDIQSYFTQRRLVVDEAEIPLWLDVAGMGPARMALFGDLLEQARGRR